MVDEFYVHIIKAFAMVVALECAYLCMLCFVVYNYINFSTNLCSISFSLVGIVLYAT